MSTAATGRRPIYFVDREAELVVLQARWKRVARFPVAIRAGLTEVEPPARGRAPVAPVHAPFRLAALVAAHRRSRVDRRPVRDVQQVPERARDAHRHGEELEVRRRFDEPRETLRQLEMALDEAPVAGAAVARPGGLASPIDLSRPHGTSLRAPFRRTHQVGSQCGRSGGTGSARTARRLWKPRACRPL